MNIDEKIKYWIDLADYDIETAKAMLESKRYLYVTKHRKNTSTQLKNIDKNIDLCKLIS